LGRMIIQINSLIKEGQLKNTSLNEHVCTLLETNPKVCSRQ